MSDEQKITYKVIVTSIGTYTQKEGDPIWTLIPGSALDEYTPIRLTNEQVEKYFKTEKAQAELNEAVQEVVAAMAESLTELGEHLRSIVREYAESVQAVWEQLQAGIISAENQTQEPQRPDYKTRPRCCTRAKVKPHRKQRSRER